MRKYIERQQSRIHQIDDLFKTSNEGREVQVSEYLKSWVRSNAYYFFDKGGVLLPDIQHDVAYLDAIKLLQKSKDASIRNLSSRFERYGFPEPACARYT